MCQSSRLHLSKLNRTVKMMNNIKKKQFGFASNTFSRLKNRGPAAMTAFSRNRSFRSNRSRCFLVGNIIGILGYGLSNRAFDHWRLTQRLVETVLLSPRILILLLFLSCILHCSFFRCCCFKFKGSQVFSSKLTSKMEGVVLCENPMIFFIFLCKSLF